jgi:hypothetical protein
MQNLDTEEDGEGAFGDSAEGGTHITKDTKKHNPEEEKNHVPNKGEGYSHNERYHVAKSRESGQCAHDFSKDLYSELATIFSA